MSKKILASKLKLLLKYKQSMCEIIGCIDSRTNPDNLFENHQDEEVIMILAIQNSIEGCPRNYNS